MEGLGEAEVVDVPDMRCLHGVLDLFTAGSVSVSEHVSIFTCLRVSGAGKGDRIADATATISQATFCSSCPVRLLAGLSHADSGKESVRTRRAATEGNVCNERHVVLNK